MLRLPFRDTSLIKRTSSIVVCFLLVSYMFLSHAERVDAVGDMGGCLRKNAAQMKTELSDHPACLQVLAMEGCLNNVELYIRNDCEEAFTYEMNGGTYEIYNYDDWLQESESGNTSAVTDVTDKTVSQELGKWRKELKYKDDPSKIITVDVTVKSKKNQFLNDEKLWLVAMALAGGITVGSVVLLVIKLMKKRARRGGKRM